MDNEYTRKEKPCLLSGTEFCDREDKECSWCISEEIKWERGDFDYTLEDVLMGSLDQDFEVDI